MSLGSVTYLDGINRDLVSQFPSHSKGFPVQQQQQLEGVYKE